jgi:hypothetical protein
MTPYQIQEIVNSFVEVTPKSFGIIRETLQRIGIPSTDEKTLYQTCHILHKRGRYYIVHYKELMLLDGLDVKIDRTDIHRRNTITALLKRWHMLELVSDQSAIKDQVSLESLKVLQFDEAGEWQLVPKYTIGKYKSGNAPSKLRQQ